MKKTISALILVLLSLSLLVCCGEDEKYGSTVGSRCPEYTLSTFSSGSDSIANHKGDTVIIHFFGFWCESGELEALGQIAAENEDVTVMAIHSTHELSTARDQINEYYSGSDIIFMYDVAVKHSEDKYYTTLGGTDTYPRTLILDGDGIITFVKDGHVTYEELNSNI